MQCRKTYDQIHGFKLLSDIIIVASNLQF